MKTTCITIATALIIMMISLNGFSAIAANPLKDVTSAKVITTYLEATTLGSTDMNNFLFADDFEYRNTVNGDRFTKKAYSNFLKSHKGIKFDCQTTYEILDQSGQACVAKATMQFKNFTRIDYITLCQTQDGWKVTKVVTSYPKK
ncbi:nuclear transport factor 2 family protein [Sphingobacterium deserti]|uniref:Uncharacterized protein n=1 Tax=Sphingobacterium deserti TaxID=1229276 RepID=A0A0B8T3H1_9SPHI|nr:nuclear transport factor 2 family protein [Sphingobacterium deserti]KGE13608.1 hypothetical protein DI53_2669 [Sphingobacterium deserti]